MTAPSGVDLSSYPKLWVQSGDDVCARINFLFARKYVSQFVIRITGGAGLIGDQHRALLPNLRHALEGFSGVGLFGATSIRDRANPTIIRDCITEVFPRLQSRMLKIGVAAKTEDWRVTPFGLVVHDDPSHDWFTTANYGADAILMTQPNADKHAPWDAEYKECLRIVDELQNQEWGSLLLVFNGGKVTEKEVMAWVELERQLPGCWPVLLVKGSGRIADELANDQEFLRVYPNVHVTDGSSAEAVRRSLVKLSVPLT